MQKALYMLVAACVLVMNTQYGIAVPLGSRAVNLGLVDILLWGTFALWAGSMILQRKLCSIKLPPAVAFALPAVGVLMILLHGTGGNAADTLKELVQLVQYFIVAMIVFINVPDSREKFRNLVCIFAGAVGLVVVWALVDYLRQDSAFAVSGPFGNMNVLGSFFALALPFVFALGLFGDFGMPARAAMIAAAVIGAVVTLSGAAFGAAVAGMLLLLALKDGRLMAGGVAVLLAGIFILTPVLRSNHVDVMTNSVAVYIENNHLLSSSAKLSRAIALNEAGRKFDALRLLSQLELSNEITPEARNLLYDIDAEMRGRQRPSGILPERGVVPAVRYQRWQAAIWSIRSNPMGHGLGRYERSLHFGTIHPRYSYETDDPVMFNVGINMPDSDNQFLVAGIEMGLLGLVGLLAFYLWSLGAAGKLFAAAREPLERAVGAGAMAALIFMPIAAAYSEIIVRGVALPFVFIISSVCVMSKRMLR